MSAHRLNITLPEDVVETLKTLAGPREQSNFIAKSVRYYARRLQRKKLFEELKLQYEEAAADGLAVTREFDSALTDGLDDEND